MCGLVCPSRTSERERMRWPSRLSFAETCGLGKVPLMCVYYCSTYYKAVRVYVCVFVVCVFTAEPSTKLFAWGGYWSTITKLFALLFITAVPNTKLCVMGQRKFAVLLVAVKNDQKV
jgi:hypothetical protein